MTNLPLFLRVASKFLNKKAELSIGETKEIKNWRIHRYMDSLTITDLTFAGKRGKNVLTLVVVSDTRDVAMIATISASVMVRAERGVSVNEMKSDLDQLLEAYDTQGTSQLKLYVREEKGVRVVPAGFAPFKIRTDKFYLELELNDFTLRNVEDEQNGTTCYANGSKKEIPAFYRFVKDNEAAIKHMSYRELRRALSSMDIQYREYCSVD